jgi:hypothetical protein
LTSILKQFLNIYQTSHIDHAESRKGERERYRQQDEGEGVTEAEVLLSDVCKAMSGRERFQMPPDVGNAHEEYEDL